MGATVEDLEAEIQELREDLRLVKRELGRLRRVIESGGTASSAASSVSRLDVFPEPSETEGYSLVTPAPSTPAVAGVAPPVIAPASLDGTLPVASGLPLTWSQRDLIARDIGGWLLKALHGTQRGLSGRERLPYSSRVWLVLRDFAGEIQDPVQVHQNWATCKLQVKRGNSCGSSVFIGLPSQREARIAVETAGLRWPN